MCTHSTQGSSITLSGSSSSFLFVTFSVCYPYIHTYIHREKLLHLVVGTVGFIFLLVQAEVDLT